MSHIFSPEDGNLYDVIAVNLKDSSILWIEERKTLPNAEAIEMMAIMRQGVEDRFFKHVPTGICKHGEKYHG